MADDTTLYYTGPTYSVFAISKAGVGPILLHSDAELHGIAVDCVSIYWIHDMTLGHVAWADKLTGMGGGQVGFPFQHVGHPNHNPLVGQPIDDDLQSREGRGGAHPKLISGQPNRIAVDDSYVYWTDTTFIGRAPK